MRIISKYKDFYDFIAQDHDADVTYVRKPFLVYENYDKMYTKESAKRYAFTDPSWFSKEKNMARMTSFVFGIYPYVYSQPVMHIVLGNKTGFGTECFDYVLTKREVEECLQFKKDNELEKYLQAMAKREGYNIVKKKETLEIPKNVKMGWMYDFKEYYWKVECPDVFMKIGAPVFIRNTNYVDFNQYGLECKISERVYYVANFWFTKLGDNMIKCWLDELMDLNTYINIENYLWASKKEPESVPDNNTKIINHGFDLKTSFRKM